MFSWLFLIVENRNQTKDNISHLSYSPLFINIVIVALSKHLFRILFKVRLLLDETNRKYGGGKSP